MRQGLCACVNKFFDDEKEMKCLGCKFSCETCFNSTLCESCDHNSHRVIDDF